AWRSEGLQQEHPQVGHEVPRHSVVGIVQKYIHVLSAKITGESAYSSFAGIENGKRQRSKADTSPPALLPLLRLKKRLSEGVPARQARVEDRDEYRQYPGLRLPHGGRRWHDAHDSRRGGRLFLSG